MQTPVILKPVNTEMYKDNNNEPQYVTVRSVNSATLFIDSRNPKLETDKTNMLISTIKTDNDKAATLFTNVSRIGIPSVGIDYASPNINPINNEISIYSSVTGTFHSVLLAVQYYTTALSIITEITNKLNTITGITGLTFTYSVVRDSFYILTSAGGTYYFNQNCTAALYGPYGLSKSTTLDFNHIVGTVTLFYTRYIDVCSSTLTKYQKLSSKTIGPNNNVIFSLYIVDGTKPAHIYGYEIDIPKFNYNPKDKVNYIDIQLKDEFGNYLWIDPRDNGFFWDMSILLEA
jgi:hypothetical protein